MPSIRIAVLVERGHLNSVMAKISPVFPSAWVTLLSMTFLNPGYLETIEIEIRGLWRGINIAVLGSQWMKV